MRSTPSDDLNPLPTPPDRPEPARNSAPPILVIDGAVLLPELPRFSDLYQSLPYQWLRRCLVAFQTF